MVNKAHCMYVCMYVLYEWVWHIKQAPEVAKQEIRKKLSTKCLQL